MEMEITEILSHLGGGEDSSEWGSSLCESDQTEESSDGVELHPPSRDVNWLKRESGDKSPDVGSHWQGSSVALPTPPCEGGSGSPHSKEFPAGPSVFGGGPWLLPGSFQLPEEQEADRDSFQSPQAEKQGPYNPDQDFGVS